MKERMHLERFAPEADYQVWSAIWGGVEIAILRKFRDGYSYTRANTGEAFYAPAVWTVDGLVDGCDEFEGTLRECLTYVAGFCN